MRQTKFWKTALKVAAWTVMGVVLFVAAILMGVINILTPERLTPLCERIATQALQNVKVEIDRVELTIMNTFPFVHAEIDNLTLLSTVTDSIAPELRRGLPAYTDTVLTVGSFRGGLNVMKLFANQVELSDVTIDRPAANLVVIDSKTSNFDIIPVKEEETEPFNWNEIPGISLRRFTITNPGKIRFYNHPSATEINAGFTEVDLDGAEAPHYTLNFDGNVEPPSEFYDFVNIPDLKFGLNGSMHWSQEQPSVVALENFDFLFSILAGRINTEVDFSNGVNINTLDVSLLPISLIQALNMVPAPIREDFGLPSPEQVNTDAELSLDFRLEDSWNIGSDTIAPFTMTAYIPECFFEGYGAKANDFSTVVTLRLVAPWYFPDNLPDLAARIRIKPMAVKWDRLTLSRFSADIEALLPEGNLYDAVVNINEVYLKGPATDLQVKGRVYDLLTDPGFDGTVEGHADLGKLPKRVADAIDGSVSGRITANIGLKGSQSMLNTENFHKLYLNGDLTFNDLYFVSGDTVNMFDIHKARFHFGTADEVKRRGKTLADSLMRVSLSIDSALILHSDIAMNLTRFRINLAAQNTSERLTKGRINPMGGDLSLKSFNLLKTNDSTVVRLRDLKGRTVIKAYNNDISTPEFIFDLNVKRLATGNKESRILINDAHTHFDAHRIAKNQSSRRFTRIADSVHYAHPHLPPDSVMKYALEIHNRHRSKYPRVHEKYEASDSLDVIDWGASPLFKRMLNLWSFNGVLTSHRAGVFTPYLPLRNRFRNINVTFDNDTVQINNLQYKIGHSDFTINGIVSNMKRAFTGNDPHQPLRVNFEMISDTIDINQLTEAMLAGSAYSVTPVEHRHIDFEKIDEDEDRMEEHIARLTENAPDSVMPILIPENLDAQFSMRSNNVLYSDFALKNMRGRVLAYNGALNMQNLSASSQVGSIDISALYSGLHPDDLRFGFSLKLKDFNLHKFLNLVPAVDSLLPVMRDFGGIISADIAATSDVDRHMNLELSTLDAAIGIKGDSLVLLDPDTFKSLSKWLLFKDKQKNIIDHMDVQMVVKDNQVDVYPFIFDFDRYKIGVQGYNDFNMNFDYHIAILKSPIPFKFGINISGNPEKYKIRLGGAKFGDQQIRQVAIVDTTRVNLMNEINNVFRRGARNARLARLRVDTKPLAAGINLAVDSLTHADSLRFIQEGLIDAPPADTHDGKNRRRKGKNRDSETSQPVVETSAAGLVPLVATMTVVRQRRVRRRPRHSEQNPKA